MKARILRSDRRRYVILDKISGIIPHSRICLLLGPPGSGKSTLLQALAGKLDAPDLRISGEMTYNGHTFKEFVPQRTSAYVNQYDEHMAELTVRETLDFSRRVQGAGSREGNVNVLTVQGVRLPLKIRSYPAWVCHITPVHSSLVHVGTTQKAEWFEDLSQILQKKI